MGWDGGCHLHSPLSCEPVTLSPLRGTQAEDWGLRLRRPLPHHRGLRCGADGRSWRLGEHPVLHAPTLFTCRGDQDGKPVLSPVRARLPARTEAGAC